MSKKNEKIYIEGYLGQLAILKISYRPEEKNKTQQFYYKVRTYIQDAFYRFEQDWASGKLAQLTQSTWIAFNKEFRKTHSAFKQAQTTTLS